MSLTVEATYENGVLKLREPLPLEEHEAVRITIHSVTSPLLRSYGLMGFTGTREEADYFAADPELDFPSSPEGQ